MKEITFLKRNANKWKEYEAFLDQKEEKDPDQLAETFIELTDDLSYAKTFYPESNTTKYLNGLTAQFHQEIYRNKREHSGRIWEFWSLELPLLIRKYHKQLLYAFLIMLISTGIGVISQVYDEDFVNIILGADYVNMTIDNIENNDPMGVYDQGNQIITSLGLMFHNIRVSFAIFMMGLLFSVGTGLMLFYNGVMLGCFFTLFYQHNAMQDAMYFVWLHGTLEIWAIIMGGCAGLVLGRSILFPKSYSRKVSLMNGAREGLKIIIGVVPLFIVAGFIEGTITRLSGMPPVMNLIIIFGSLFFIVWYFVVYPILLENRMKYG